MFRRSIGEGRIGRVTLGMWVVLWVVVEVTAGCGGASQSVRALRQYGGEPSDLKVALDRIEDMERSLELAQRLLYETPYRPGAAWVKQLPMTDEQGELLEQQQRQTALYADRDFRVPVSKLYRIHIEQVLADGDMGGEEATTPSVMAALAQVTAQGQALVTRWEELEAKAAAAGDLRSAISQLDVQYRAALKADSKAQMQRLSEEMGQLKRQADALSDEHEAGVEAYRAELASLKPEDLRGSAATTVVTDLVTVFSVVARLDLEAAALATVLTTQVYRSLLTADVKELGITAAELAPTIHNTVARLSRVGELVADQAEVMVVLAAGFGALQGIALSDSPGFAYGESAAEMVAGFALDSFFLDVEAGGEAFFFNSSDTVDTEDNTTSVEQGDRQVSYDYTGRQFRLEYDVQPIVLASIGAKAGFDWGGIANFLNLNLDYKTDRIYQSGGTIDREADALETLGVQQGVVSDVLGVGLAVAGVTASATLARFNAGEVRLLDATSGATLETAPLQIDYTEVNLSYDFIFVLRDTAFATFIDSLTAGLRYVNYQLPRIIYEFEDTNSDPNIDDYVYVRESPPQPLDHTFYMGGGSIKRGNVVGSDSGFMFELGLYLGGGPTQFTMVEGRNPTDRSLFGLVVDGMVGWSFSFTDTSARLQSELVLLYEARLIATGVLGGDSINEDEEDDLGETSYTISALDVFHGPRGSFRLRF